MRRRSRRSPMRGAPPRSRGAPTTFSRARWPSDPSASRASPRSRCRTPTARRASCAVASRSSASAARWSTGSPRSATRTRWSISTTPATRASGPSAAQIYEGHPWLLGPTWAFGQETAVHALRLMASGLFDRHPRLQIILGHLGEGLPYSIWRVDNRNAWTKAPPRYPAKKKLGEYFQQNFHLTTSGNFRTQTLIDAMLEIGSDRIML